MPDQAVTFNPGYLEDMSGGDEEFVREIIGTFFETSRDLVEGIRAAAEEGSAEKGIYVAHTLKGSSRSIGALCLGDICESLEKLARASDMTGFAVEAPRVQEAFVALQAEVAQVYAAKAA